MSIITALHGTSTGEKMFFCKIRSRGLGHNFECFVGTCLALFGLSLRLGIGVACYGAFDQFI